MKTPTEAIKNKRTIWRSGSFMFPQNTQDRTSFLEAIYFTFLRKTTSSFTTYTTPFKIVPGALSWMCLSQPSQHTFPEYLRSVLIIKTNRIKAWTPLSGMWN